MKIIWRNLAAKLSAGTPVTVETQQRLDVLLREATTHFERGRASTSKEEYRSAITSWDDALRLARGYGRGTTLEGRILALASGVRVLAGQVKRAQEEATVAIQLLDPVAEAKYYWWAKGNLAFALTNYQEYDKAERLYDEILRHYEEEAEPVEIVRTLQNLVEAFVQRGEPLRALPHVERLKALVASLMAAGGKDELLVGTLGTIGNVFWSGARSASAGPASWMRTQALSTYRELQRAAKGGDLRRLLCFATGQIGLCLWDMGMPADGLTLVDEALVLADLEFGKAAADLQYNRGCILEELERKDESIQAFEDAHRRYLALGDLPSAADAKERLNEYK